MRRCIDCIQIQLAETRNDRLAPKESHKARDSPLKTQPRRRSPQETMRCPTLRYRRHVSAETRRTIRHSDYRAVGETDVPSRGRPGSGDGGHVAGRIEAGENNAFRSGSLSERPKHLHIWFVNLSVTRPCRAIAPTHQVWTVEKLSGMRRNSLVIQICVESCLGAHTT